MLLTKEIIKKEVNAQGFILLDCEVGYKGKITYCDDKGYKYSTIWESFINRHNKMPICLYNEYSIENIKTYLKNNKIPVELKSNTFIGVTENLLFTGLCGHELECSWNNFKRRKHYICNKCAEKEYKSKKRLAQEEIEKLYEENDLFLLDSYEYKRNNVKRKCINGDGYIGELSYSNLQFGKKFQPFLKTNPYSIQNIKTYLIKNEIDLKLISSEYIDCDDLLSWKCNCGELFYKSWGNVKSGKGLRCPRCLSLKNNSNIAIKTENFLISNKINFEREKKFKDCKSIKMLPFDFYIESLNLCIEIDGIQHFEPIAFRKQDESKTIKEFKELKKRDNIKNKFCEENSINLLRIPYWEFETDEYIDSINQWLK